MPFLSDKELTKVQSFVGAAKSRANRAREKAAEKAGEMRSTLECVGAAGAMGYWRGKREDAGGVWNAPFIKFDMELLTGLSLVGMAFFDLFGRWDNSILNAGNGILSHYTGQVMRKMAKTGTFSQVAGGVMSQAGIGALPQYDPTSFNATQMASPHADPVAAALAKSGL